MKISQRLILGFSSLVTIFGVFGIYVYVNNQKIESNIHHLDELYEEAALHHIPSLDYSLRLLLDLEKAKTALSQYITTRDRAAKQDFLRHSQNFERDKAAFLSNLKEGKIEEFYTHHMHEDEPAIAMGGADEHDSHNHNHEHDRDHEGEDHEELEQLGADPISRIIKNLEQVDQQYQALYREELKAAEIAKQGNLAAASQYMTQVINPQSEKINQLLYAIEKDARKELKHLTFVDEHIHSVVERINRFKLAIFFIIGLSVLLATIISYCIIQSISYPVLKLKNAAEEWGKGELDKTVDIHSNDELGILANAFNQMSERLNELYAHLAQKVTELEQSEAQLQTAKTAIESENLRMSAELDVTRRLQEMILPKADELSRVSNLEIAGFMQPAAEVGGDYYDVLQRDGRVKIGIGDVTGHGLESGVLMLMVQTAVRTLLESNLTDSRKFLNILNRVIYDNVQRMNSDKNLTLSLLDYQGGKLSLSGQHEEMLVVRSDGEIELIDTIDLGFPLGLTEDIASFINQTDVQLAAGDGVVLYTDGITEAESPSKEEYGLERLCQIVSQNWHRSTDEIRRAIINDVECHIKEQTIYDDITLLVLKQK